WYAKTVSMAIASAGARRGDAAFAARAGAGPAGESGHREIDQRKHTGPEGGFGLGPDCDRARYHTYRAYGAGTAGGGDEAGRSTGRRPHAGSRNPGKRARLRDRNRHSRDEAI